jgi:phospholipid/cholesterol/gamma-HCH transport system permease protein
VARTVRTIGLSELPGVKKVALLVRETGSMFALAMDAIRFLPSRPFPRAEFFEQCWFLVRVCTLPLILIAVPLGLVIALLVGSLLSQFGASSQMGAALVVAVVREIGPVTAALIIAGAGGSAMCSDLGSRRIRDEISAMEVMGVNPVHRLVLPRILASVVLGFLLNAVVTVAGLASGYFFATTSAHVTPSSFFSSFNELGQTSDFYLAAIKACIFGFLAAMVACYRGLNCKPGAKGVGQAVNNAVVITVLLLFFVNVVLTALYINFVPQKVL